MLGRHQQREIASDLEVSLENDGVSGEVIITFFNVENP